MENPALSRLSLLGHPLRARLFGLLVRRLPHGVAAGDIALALAVPPSTLSAHLAALTAAGLLVLEREGALRLYRAAPARLGEAALWAEQVLCLGRTGHGQAVMPRRLRLLFLCDDNASLSLMAEALARRRLAGRIMAASAGLCPAPVADPLVLALLERRGHDLLALAPKPLRAAPQADLVIALTPTAADVMGTEDASALYAYWPVAPPGALPGENHGDAALIPRAVALHRVYRALNTRLAALRGFVEGPPLPRAALQAALDDLSSGLPAGDHACASRPAPRQSCAGRAPRASAAS